MIASFAPLMLRSSLAVFLAITMMMTNFTRFFIYAGFELNKEYIAKTLCINLNKPELKCQGKCYLSNKIKLAEEKEKSTERENQKKSFQEAFMVKTKTGLINSSWLLKKQFTHLQNAKLPQGISEILHPPPRIPS